MGFAKYKGQTIERGALKLSGTMVLADDIDDDVYLLVKGHPKADKIGEDTHGATTKTVFVEGKTMMLVPDGLRDKVVKELKLKADEEAGTPALPLDGE